MYIYICIYIFAYIHMYIHMNMYVYLYIYISLCIFIFIYIYIYIYIYTYIRDSPSEWVPTKLCRLHAHLQFAVGSLRQLEHVLSVGRFVFCGVALYTESTARTNLCVQCRCMS